MKKILWLLPALAFVFLSCNNQGKDSVEKADSANDAKSDSGNNQQPALGVDESTSDFMVKVANGGMTEVEISQVAKDKASNKRVKEFASMMVTDHSKANDELKALAGKKNVTLPTAVSDENKNKMDDLKKKTGKDFDRAYMDMMEDDHDKTVNAFEKASGDTKDADVKAWVDKTLPTLRMHLDSAKAIHKMVKQ
jgi:putative membrane protein